MHWFGALNIHPTIVAVTHAMLDNHRMHSLFGFRGLKDANTQS